MKLYEQYIPSVYDHPKEASRKLLRGLWQLDSLYMPNHTFGRYIYFFPTSCNFVITQQQLHKYLVLKVDPFYEIDVARVIEITSFKYDFSTILVGVFVERKLITERVFLDIVRKKPEWF